jgi:hypothetical protein
VIAFTAKAVDAAHPNTAINQHNDKIVIAPWAFTFF